MDSVKSLLFVAILSLLSPSLFSQDAFRLEEVRITFISYTEETDFVGFTKSCTGLVNFQDSTFSVKVPVKEFFMFRPKMKEGFDNICMETEKYPEALFSGKLYGNFPTDSIGEYRLMTDGIMEVHGQTQERKIGCLIHYDGEKYGFRSTFKISLDEFGISGPDEYKDRIAEAIVVEVFGILQKE